MYGSYIAFFDSLTLYMNTYSHGFDVYFQDDGSRGIFYAPFSANTGFYYVRYDAAGGISATAAA